MRSAVLHVISLARVAIVSAQSSIERRRSSQARLGSRCNRLKAEIALLGEQLRIRDARMQRIAPQRRPHYTPIERMAILQLRASHGWSVEQTADAFLVTPATVTSWMQRIDEQAPNALVQTHEPVNRFPDFVHYIVRRLKTLCPALGKVKIAQFLARAGLHLGSTTVGRILHDTPKAPPAEGGIDETTTERVVTAKKPNHVWHVDLTTVPTSVGFWTAWPPFALPQCWPFCWWLAIALDHYSRRVLGFAVFRKQPSSQAVRSFLDRTIRTIQVTPKYLVCDKGCQFWCDRFKSWCREQHIRARFGAVGQYGSLAILERFILTLKAECTRRLVAVPFRRAAFRREVQLYLHWYNDSRPHTSLGGRTPNEVYHRLRAANQQPRFEPRPRWPRASPCAAPQVLVKGQPGVRLELQVRFVAGRKHLPILTLRRAA